MLVFLVPLEQSNSLNLWDIGGITGNLLSYLPGTSPLLSTTTYDDDDQLDEGRAEGSVDAKSAAIN